MKSCLWINKCNEQESTNILMINIEELNEKFLVQFSVFPPALHSTPLDSCDAISPPCTHWMACIGWWCDFVFTVFDALYFHQNTREQRFRGNVNIISLPHDRNNSAITLTVLNWFLFGECMRFNLYGDSCVFFCFHAQTLPWFCSSLVLHRKLLNMRLHYNATLLHFSTSSNICTPIRERLLRTNPLEICK